MPCKILHMRFFLRFIFLAFGFCLYAAEPVVILGGGVGALTSAIYLARAGLHPIVIEGQSPGGLLTQSHAVQNWPGEIEIEGVGLTEKIREQAKANGAVLLSEEVVAVDFSRRPFVITTRSFPSKKKLRTIEAQSCIIAMGTEPNFLQIPGESTYWGQGVSNCAICDGTLYRDRVVGVVGGGDAAVLEANYLADLAKEVHIFVRKSAFRAVEQRRLQQLQRRPNVKIHYQTVVEEVKGDEDHITYVALKTSGERWKLPLDGLFLAIGSRPNSKLFQGALKLDEKGYIFLEKDQQTSLKGVFAIGDIVDPIYKQAISAAGDGAKAALQVKQYLSDSAKQSTSGNFQPKEEFTFSGDIVEIFSEEQFQKELERSEVPVIVDFYASWCGPCKRLSPVLETFAQHLSGKARFFKVNVDTLGNLTRFYQVRAMPTVLVFDPSGNVSERRIGSEQITQFLESLKEHSMSAAPL